MAQPNYTYTHPSSRSTRQILESSFPSSSDHNNTSIPFRPQLGTHRSSNYASADALSRAAAAESVEKSSPQEAGTEQSDETSAGGAGVAWKPKFGRKQSWNRQDLKRELMMSGIAGRDGESGQDDMGNGFSVATGGAEVGK